MHLQYFVVGSFVGDKINDWLKDVFKTIMDFAVSGVKAILDQLNTSLPIIDKWHGIFLAFAISMVVVVIPEKIIMMLISEVEESTDVTAKYSIDLLGKSAVKVETGS